MAYWLPPLPLLKILPREELALIAPLFERIPLERPLGEGFKGGLGS